MTMDLKISLQSSYGDEDVFLRAISDVMAPIN